MVDNLDIDTQYSQDYYHTDAVFNEEIKALGDGGPGMSDANEGDAMGEQVKQSKEYLEVNFQFNYSGDDDSPIKIGIDVNAGQTQPPEPAKN